MGAVTVALRKGTGGFKALLQAFLVITTTCGAYAHAADGAAACRDPVARIVSIQGDVEVQSAGETTWAPVKRLDTALCDGDRLRTGPLSRSALFVQPESIVRIDRNTTIAVSRLPDETLVEFFQDRLRRASSNSCGAGYFISRFPRKLKVNTPSLSAAVEGTEFLVAMNCETDQVSVFEGKVKVSQLTDASASVTLGPGQTATAGPGEAPVLKLNIKPEDAVQWVVYYPPLTPPDAQFVEDCRTVAGDQRAACLVARAERLLRAGHVDEAKSQIQDATAVAPLNSDAKALQSIVSLVRNEKEEALRLANEAVALNSGSAPAWLALSYAQQAHFQLEAALTSAQRTAELAPDNSLAASRIAELQLSLGWTAEAEKTALRAVDIDASNGRAHTILGYVHLTQFKVSESRIDFEHALELDSTDPLARLGLGLAIIRKGLLQEGREQIEIAVALDPTNSLLRSYVGKAYFEENIKERDRLAEMQFDLAKSLDSNDPTPWFYAAVAKQSQNRPIEALDDALKATQTNNGRAVYRSEFLLEADRASRSVSLAQSYADIGYESQAINEGARSLLYDPSSYSAHRLLADVYAGKSGYDIARVSELLQSQLYQPININPVQPNAPFVDLAIPQSLQSPKPGFNEYTSLFERNRTQLSAAGLAGTNHVAADELILSGVLDHISYSIGQFHFQSDGFRENNDQLHNIYDIFGQIALSPDISVQAEYRHRETEQGDLTLRGDPQLLDPFFRSDLQEEIGRIGMHISPSPGLSIIASLVNFDAKLDQTIIPDPLFLESREEKGNQFEFRSDISRPYFSLTAGAGTYRSQVHQFDNFGTDFTFVREKENAYAYLNLPMPFGLHWTIGTSYESNKREGAFVDQDGRWNSKFGLQWQPIDAIQVRGAVFETSKAALFTQQTVEPTTVAGFNQFFDDLNGTLASNEALGIDIRLSSSTNVSAEYQRRELEIPLSIVGLGTVLTSFETEQHGDVAITQTLANNWALTGQWHSLRIESDGLIGVYTHLETQTMPITLRYFGGNVRVELRGTYVRQSVDNSIFASAPGTETSEFSTYDMFLAYYLPRRLGTISLEGTNLANKSFFYMDLNTRSPTIKNPAFIPERQVFLRASVKF